MHLLWLASRSSSAQALPLPVGENLVGLAVFGCRPRRLRAGWDVVSCKARFWRRPWSWRVESAKTTPIVISGCVDDDLAGVEVFADRWRSGRVAGRYGVRLRARWRRKSWWWYLSGRSIVISYTAWFRRLPVALLVMITSVDCGIF
jgi:hypothetical protein